MDFIANKEKQNREMLALLGISSVEELFQVIPPQLMRRPPAGDDGLSEYEALRLLESIAAENTFPQLDNYLGAGAYEHHVPALVGAICSKSEFLTAYTPYQAEMSQGLLQAIFEFQSAVCALTGLDIANASVYDGASACAEAVLMALRCRPDRNKILIAGDLHPHYRAVITQYLGSHAVDIVTIPFQENGSLDPESVRQLADRQTAGIILQSPNFFGVVNDVSTAFTHSSEQGALGILCVNPLAYGLYASAGSLGADIAVGDMQPFGIPLQFGGPYAGYMACRQEWVRQLPGRLVGETTDNEGRRGFVLTLQAREQHIRREKATSNICTNQSLAALASLIALLWYGKEGVKKLALTNFQRASYLRDCLSRIPGIKVDTSIPIFNEFVVELSEPAESVQKHLRERGIEPGLNLARYFPGMDRHLLVAVTETKDQAQLDRYALEVAGILFKRKGAKGG